MISDNDAQQLPTTTANFLWLAILALAGLGGSLVISCVTPLVALAVALAGTVRLTVALRAMIAIWLTNQFLGFAFLHFPRTSNTFLWGVVIGVAALLSTLVASIALRRAPSWSTPARIGRGVSSAPARYAEAGLFDRRSSVSWEEARLFRLRLSRKLVWSILPGLLVSSLLTSCY